MKRRSVFLVFLSIVLIGHSAVAGGTREAGGGFDLETHRFREHGFAIDFPGSWSIGTSDQLVVYARNDEPDAADTFAENVSVAVYDLPSQTSLSDLADSLLADLRNYERIDEGAVTIDGHDVRYVIRSTSIGSTTGVLLAYMFIRGDTGYSISCWSLKGEFDVYRPLFERIASSFRFIG